MQKEAASTTDLHYLSHRCPTFSPNRPKRIVRSNLSLTESVWLRWCLQFGRGPGEGGTSCLAKGTKCKLTFGPSGGTARPLPARFKLN